MMCEARHPKHDIPSTVVHIRYYICCAPTYVFPVQCNESSATGPLTLSHGRLCIIFVLPSSFLLLPPSDRIVAVSGNSNSFFCGCSPQYPSSKRVHFRQGVLAFFTSRHNRLALFASANLWFSQWPSKSGGFCCVDLLLYSART